MSKGLNLEVTQDENLELIDNLKDSKSSGPALNKLKYEIADPNKNM